MASEKVLVTGGSGLVGQAIQWAVQSQDLEFGRCENEDWIFLRSADGDLREYQQARAIFEKHLPTKVIHLAARVGGMFENSQKPVDFLHDNVLIDQNVLRLCNEFNIQSLVSTLSTCIFPDRVTYPIEASQLHDGPPHGSNYAYAYAKRLLETTSRAYRDQFKRNFVTVVPTNIYGPYDSFGVGCHCVPGIIKRVHNATRQHTQTMLFPGSGRAERQMIYSRDLAKLLIWAMHNYKDPEPLVLSTGEADEISIRNIVEIVCKLYDWKGSIQWTGNVAEDGQLKKTVDNSKLKALVSSFTFTSFEQGIEETIMWVRDHSEVVEDGVAETVPGLRSGT